MNTMKKAWIIFSIALLLLISSCDAYPEGKQGDGKVVVKASEAVSSSDKIQKKLPIRQPKGAGSFYPAEKDDLFTLVEKLLAKGKGLDLPGGRAILVPHAGYVYSGEVAGAAMRELAKGFKRVFILAANHSNEADFSGVSIPEVSGYAIPGAEIPLSPVAFELRKQSLFTSVPAAHNAYMIEVELPFLYTLAGRENPPPFPLSR